MWHQIPSSTDPPWWKFDQGQEYVVQQDKPESSEWQAFAWNCPVVWCVHWCDWQHQKLASPPLHSSSWHSFNKSYTSALSSNILVLKLKCQHSSISVSLLTANDFLFWQTIKYNFYSAMAELCDRCCLSVVRCCCCLSVIRSFCPSVSKITAKVIRWFPESLCCDWAYQSQEQINFWWSCSPRYEFQITFPLPSP